MKFPKISIVTPSYNQGSFIERTICSVLDQNYPNLEYIIIDGGSTDGSIEIIKKYERYLHYWCSEKDHGHYNAVNKGINKSSGEILAWLNSDDIYFKGSFSIVAEIFNSFPSVNWLSSNHTFVDENDRVIETSSINGISKRQFFNGNIKWIQQESTFWRKSLWELSGSFLDESFKLAADYELWCRFFQFDKLFIVNTALSGFRFRRHNQKTIELLEDYLIEVSEIRKKYLFSEEKVISENSIIQKIPVIRRFFNHKKNNYQRNSSSPIIKFDRSGYSFKIDGK